MTGQERSQGPPHSCMAKLDTRPPWTRPRKSTSAARGSVRTPRASSHSGTGVVAWTGIHTPPASAPKMAKGRRTHQSSPAGRRNPYSPGARRAADLRRAAPTVGRAMAAGPRVHEIEVRIEPIEARRQVRIHLAQGIGRGTRAQHDYP